MKSGFVTVAFLFCSLHGFSRKWQWYFFLKSGTRHYLGRSQNDFAVNKIANEVFLQLKK